MIATVAKTLLIAMVIASVTLAQVNHGKKALINGWTSLAVGAVEVLLLWGSWSV